MQQERSQIPSDPVEREILALAWIAFLFLIFVVATMPGCVSLEKDGGVEPLWKPHAYLYSPSETGRCTFVDGTGHTLDCDEPVMSDYYLAPLEDLVTLKSKLQQCETWR